MQVLAQQAVGALRCLAAHPVLTFGGGCLEAWLIAQLVSSKVIYEQCNNILLHIRGGMVCYELYFIMKTK